MATKVVLQFYPAEHLPHVLRIAVNIVVASVQQRQSRIALLVPHLSDALAFRIENVLNTCKMIGYVSRPAFTKCLQPELHGLIALFLWNDPKFPITQATLAQVIHTFVGGCDPIRAHLIAKQWHKEGGCIPFAQFPSRLQQRVGLSLKQEYDRFVAIATILSQQNLEQSSEIVLTNLASNLQERYAENGESLAIALLELSRIAQDADSTPIRKFLHNLANGAINLTETIPPASSTHILVTTPESFIGMGAQVEEQIWFDVTHPAWSHYLNTAGDEPAHTTISHLIEHQSNTIHLIANRKSLAMPEKKAQINNLGLQTIWEQDL
jgi:hypothetical protein